MERGLILLISAEFFFISFSMGFIIEIFKLVGIFDENKILLKRLRMSVLAFSEGVAIISE
jgi:hypothetical protein